MLEEIGVLLSTGLWTREEMDEALIVTDMNDVTLLHTVSEYPTPMGSVNLPRIAWLREVTGLPVGYSDHTLSTTAPMAALSMGVPVLEVHHSLPGAPLQMQWDEDGFQLRAIAEFARSVEKMHVRKRMLLEPVEERKFVGRWQHGI